MKVVKKNEEEITLILETTSSDVEEVRAMTLPIDKLLYWYPLNMNYTYKFANSKHIMYLVKDPTYKGKPIYETKLLKYAEELPLKDGVPFNESVFNRNTKVVEFAMKKEILSIYGNPNLSTIEEGVICTIKYMKDFRKELQKRFILDEAREIDESLDVTSDKEDLDIILYSYATEEEMKDLNMMGEVYTLLNLMRRLQD